MNNIRLLDSLLKRMDAEAEAILVQEPGASEPEDCVLIFDRSGSMSLNDYLPTRLLAAFDAGLEFVDAKRAARLSDLISIILFDDTATVACEDVTLDEAVIILNDLKAANPIGGGTDINSGLVAAEQHFRRAAPNYKKRIVLLTDGHGGNPVRTGQRLREAGVWLQTVGVAGAPGSVAEEDLRKISSIINGVCCYRFIGDRAELLKHFKNLATDLMRVK